MHKIGEEITNMGGGMNFINCDCITHAGEENLIQITSSSTTTQGVSITVNDDNSLKLEGTSAATFNYMFQGTSSTYPLVLEAGTYKLTGGISQNCFVRLYDGSNTYDDFGEGTVITLNTTKNFNCRLRILANATLNDVIYPTLTKVM